MAKRDNNVNRIVQNNDVALLSSFFCYLYNSVFFDITGNDVFTKCLQFILPLEKDIGSSSSDNVVNLRLLF